MSNNTTCSGIDGNSDISGIGVRLAFYAQSAMNTLLVVTSPRDSVSSTWSSTVLTVALVIAGMILKFNTNISLHHAILVFNFATISCISSLAVAPMLPIWRLGPSEYYAREIRRLALSNPTGMHFGGSGNLIRSALDLDKHKQKIKNAQDRQRVVLTAALLIQVVLQWTWGIILFVSPSYAQADCSGNTTILFFFFYAARANDLTGGRFAVWPIWLLFTLGITIFQVGVLAFSGPSKSQEEPELWSLVSRSDTTQSSPTSLAALHYVHLSFRDIAGKYQSNIRQSIARFRDSWRKKIRGFWFWYYLSCILLWTLYLSAIERQRIMNNVHDENSFVDFGQITAVLLALTPLWSLIIALYKYPHLRQRLKREKRRWGTRASRGTHSRKPSKARRTTPILEPGSRVCDSPQALELTELRQTGSGMADDAKNAVRTSISSVKSNQSLTEPIQTRTSSHDAATTALQSNSRPRLPTLRQRSKDSASILISGPEHVHVTSPADVMVPSPSSILRVPSRRATIQSRRAVRIPTPDEGVP